MNFDDALDTPYTTTQDSDPSGNKLSFPLSFITGPAGSGKTTLIKQKSEEDPRYTLLCATTGAASVNLGAVTLNSTLKFFDVNSLRERMFGGGLFRTLADLHFDYDNLCVDECSMMGADLCDLLISLWQEYHDWKKPNSPFGLIFTGDFAQLPPVNAKWAFEGANWKLMPKENVTKLTKIWRQTDPEFLAGLAAARRGNGREAVELLAKAGVRFGCPELSTYEGTQIYATRAECDQTNLSKVGKLTTPVVTKPFTFWGTSRSEWKELKDRFYGKLGCRVIIRRNQTPEFEYVNGDAGELVEWKEGQDPVVRIDRNGREVVVRTVTDYNDIPSGDVGKYAPAAVKNRDERGVLRHYIGSVTFWPLTLGYAVTCHSSQGQTLDKVQVSFRHKFISSPNMAYVALSRCRTPQGLTIVGNKETVMRSIQVDPKVKEWI